MFENQILAKSCEIGEKSEDEQISALFSDIFYTYKCRQSILDSLYSANHL